MTMTHYYVTVDSVWVLFIVYKDVGKESPLATPFGHKSTFPTLSPSLFF